jgi:hypothetical protein
MLCWEHGLTTDFEIQGSSNQLDLSLEMTQRATKSWAQKSWAQKSWAQKSWAQKSWAQKSWAQKSWAQGTRGRVS